MFFKLDEEIYFPDPRLIPDNLRDADNIYAIGGDIEPLRLYEASKKGIFPWNAYYCDMKVWYCPMTRFVIFPDEIHISHSMKQTLKSGRYTVTIDQAFDRVVVNCGMPRINEDGAWLGPKLMDSVSKLHKMGYAHSVEVWEDDELVGGLYGEFSDGCFFGESMFSKVPSGSKIALIYLAWYMKDKGYRMIDCQMETPHLKSMGGRSITYDEYMRLRGYDEVVTPFDIKEGPQFANFHLVDCKGNNVPFTEAFNDYARMFQ